MSINFQDNVTDELLLAQKQQDPNVDCSLDQGVVELVVLNTKEAALHDGFMPTSWCQLKGNRISNQIVVWSKEILRSSCSTPKRDVDELLLD